MDSTELSMLCTAYSTDCSGMWQVHLLKATLWMMCAEVLLRAEFPDVPQAPPFASVFLLPLSYAYICLGLEQS